MPASLNIAQAALTAPIAQSLPDLLRSLAGALGPLSAWFGATLLISCYGFLSKHLYLSGFGFQYSQFARTEDFGLNATQSFAFIIPAAIAAMAAGWLIVGLRRWWPRFLVALRTLVRLVGFVLQFLGYLGHDLYLRAAGWLMEKLAKGGKSARLDAITNRRESIVAPTLQPMIPQNTNDVSASLSPAILVAFVIIMGLDSAGRYAASRPEIGSDVVSCQIKAPLDCIADLAGRGLHGLGVASRLLGLSPTPERVRLIGAKDGLPQVLRSGWQSTGDASATDLWLVDRSASFLFLEACPDKVCRGQGVILSAADSATGLSFSTNVGAVEVTVPPPKAVNASVEFKASWPGESLGPLVKAASGALAKTEQKLDSVASAVKTLAEAIPRIPKRLDTSGKLTLAPGASVDLTIDDKSMTRLGESMVAMQQLGASTQQQLDQSAHKFQDCMDKRHMKRSLIQTAFGTKVSDLSDCYEESKTNTATVDPVLRSDPLATALDAAAKQ